MITTFYRDSSLCIVLGGADSLPCVVHPLNIYFLRFLSYRTVEYHQQICPICCCVMMTSSNGSVFRVTGLCERNPLVTGGFPSQRPVTRSFNVFFDLRRNKRFSKQPKRRWFETPSRSFDVIVMVSVWFTVLRFVSRHLCLVCCDIAASHPKSYLLIIANRPYYSFLEKCQPIQAICFAIILRGDKITVIRCSSSQKSWQCNPRLPDIVFARSGQQN